MWEAIAGAAAASIGGSILGSKEAKKGAKALAKQAAINRDLWEKLQLPSIEEQKIILQTPDLMGQYTPEQLQAMELNVSAMEGIKSDEQAIAEQRKALEGISEVAKGGITEADLAAARQVQRQVNQQAQARQKAILNAMASRGALGSGMELQARMQAEQQAMDQASQAGDALTQQAQARALQAMGQQGTLAGQMRQQQYGEQSDLARARDAITQFNLQNRQRVADTNIGERNRAQLLNLQQRQAQEDARAQLANQQQMYNKGLIQQDYQNRMAKLSGQTSANIQMGQAQAAQHAQNAQMIGGIASGLAGALSAYGAQQQQNAMLDKILPVYTGNTTTLASNNFDPSKTS